MTATGLPFDDVRALVARMPAPDEVSAAKAAAREARLLKPAGALGRLEEIAAWLATWQGRHPPRVDRPVAAVFAGNHGIAAKGVSAYPPSVTAEMMEAFRNGKAAINQLCAANDVGLKLFDLALDYPTADFTQEAALDEKACAGTIAFGMEAIAGGADLLCIGEMGIGNTTSAAALGAALFGGTGADWAGPGTGLDAAGVARKAAVIDEALKLHGNALADPLEALRRVGGRELAAMAGAVIAARFEKIPVIVDGFTATAAVAVLWKINPESLDHCLFAHRSAEPAHDRMLKAMGKEPLFDFSLRLGEASGAVLAVPIVRAAAALHSGMGTFDEAGVSGKA
ncbi:MAG: nicotinate-nucleotide--dimethylbenzimidazole phosphoribosyltransferase [Rhodobiaceae bacterium]|nr:nicotinate-nucleotide--dimethylbenzimidazole phosphoribosyltransferase [Rhodobiaceae bacterium]MCC0057559.1 nicotinate-nucleotide--dimethylbenzimidazole phosphoribosyltransferase [Rhodobiaceae bacterium]